MKPERVRQAQLQDNTEYLSEAGKNGAKVANENRRKKHEAEETFLEFDEEKRALEEAERRRSTNEDTVPFDGEDNNEKD